MGAAAQGKALDGRVEQRASGIVGTRISPEHLAGQPRVHRRSGLREAEGLAVAREDDPFADVGRRLLRAVVAQYVRWQPWHFDSDVDAVEQRPGDARRIPLALRRCAPARAPRVAEVAARAGVHRTDQRDARREFHRRRRARDAHPALFERLPEDLQRPALELGHLVEKEDAGMGQAQLARPRMRAATNQRHVRNRVVRRPERPLRDEPRPAGKEPGHGMDGGHLERLGRGERGQDSRQGSRHHRLARSRRPGEQHMVAARRRHLERAPRQQLPADVREVSPHAAGLRHDGVPARVTARLVSLRQSVHGLDQRGDRPHRQPRDDSRLRGIRRGHNRGADAGAGRGHRHGKHAAGGTHGAVEGERAHHDNVRVLAGGQGAGRRKDAEGDGQIIGGAFLAHVRRREVDRDVLPGELEIGIANRRPHPVAALPDTRIRQSDDREGRQPRGDVDLDADDPAVNPGERGAEQGGEHDPHGCKRGTMRRIGRFDGNPGRGQGARRSFCNSGGLRPLH